MTAVLQCAKKPRSPLLGQYTREYLHKLHLCGFFFIPPFFFFSPFLFLFLETLSSMRTCQYKLKQVEACYADVALGNWLLGGNTLVGSQTVGFYG